LPRNCEQTSDFIEPTRQQYFTNGLLIPEEHGAPGFSPQLASKPSLRSTNIGMVVVTIEFDCQNVGQFEENLAWLRKGGSSVSGLSLLIAQLSQYKEFRGCCVVFSGGKSFHHHFPISTEHFLRAPFNATAAERLASDWQTDAALMQRAYGHYYDVVEDAFESVIGPSMKADRSMRRFGQLRRLPWGVRQLEAASVLGIPAGTLVPQLVVFERILSRAPRNSKEFCLPPSFSPVDPVRSARRASRAGGEHQTVGGAMFEEARELLRTEWGPYPELVTVKIEGGEWLFRFKNHPGDATPSTIVKGNHRKLLVQGGSHSLRDALYLPDGLTAQELGDHLARCSGMRPASQTASGSSEPRPRRGGPFTLSDLRMMGTPLNSAREDIEETFPEPISALPPKEVQKAYREKLRRAVREARKFDAHVIVRSGEGIGKTSGHVPILLEEAFDEALNHSDDRMRPGLNWSSQRPPERIGARRPVPRRAFATRVSCVVCY
jgi:hypothetical protein